MKHLHLMVLALTVVAFAACEGSEGPTGPAGQTGQTGQIGPQGPQGPQGPAGASVAYQVFEGSITSDEINTGPVTTGGVVPGIVCYITSDGVTWLALSTSSDGFACGVTQETATSYSGGAIVPASFVNDGWTLRIILFWLPLS